MPETMPETMPDPAKGLIFLALGGAGEIGMNLNLYGVDDQWLMVDLGITFADESQPGIDILVPDTAWIEARRDKLLALVLTPIIFGLNPVAWQEWGGALLGIAGGGWISKLSLRQPTVG